MRFWAPSNAKFYEHYDLDGTTTLECGLRIQNGARRPSSWPIAENPMNTDIAITTSTWKPYYMLKDSFQIATLLLSLLAQGAVLCGRAADGKGEGDANARRDANRQVAPYPGCVKIFNGENFEGWEADPSTWSIVDGAMRGFQGTSRVAYTKADYGNFRLIFTARMNPENKDHLGVLFWGNRPADPSRPQVDLAGWLQFMPPFGGMWDYHPPKHHNLPHETLAKSPKNSSEWSTTEILCNLDNGTMRAAVDGVEVTRYTHPFPGERKDAETRIVPGPIGMFRHGGGASEYKDIYVEANPKEDRFLTVRVTPVK